MSDARVLAAVASGFAALLAGCSTNDLERRPAGEEPAGDRVLEANAWIDADLPRAALLREIAASTEAARADLVVDALATCGAGDAKVMDYVEQNASVMATDLVDDICQGKADDMLIAEAQFLDCRGRMPSDNELEEWAKQVAPHSAALSGKPHSDGSSRSSATVPSPPRELIRCPEASPGPRCSLGQRGGAAIRALLG